MRKALEVAALLVVLASLVSLIPGNWICDLLGQLKIVFVILLLVSALALNAVQSFKLARLAALTLVILSVPVVQMSFSSGRPGMVENQPGSKAGGGGNTIPTTFSLLNFNTECQRNQRFDLFRSLVEKEKPDVMVFVEIDKAWLEQLQSMNSEYPHQQSVLEGPGMVVCSKFAIENFEVRHFGKSNHPRLRFGLRVGDQLVNVITLHPTTPKSESGYLERNAEMALVADEIEALAAPKLIVGDLNCTPWADSFKRLCKPGMRDSEQGRGPQPTWPARTGRVVPGIPIPPLVPIDHVLVSDDVIVNSRNAGPAINSDHLPVFVRLSTASGK